MVTSETTWGQKSKKRYFAYCDGWTQVVLSISLNCIKLLKIIIFKEIFRNILFINRHTKNCKLFKHLESKENSKIVLLPWYKTRNFREKRDEISRKVNFSILVSRFSHETRKTAIKLIPYFLVNLGILRKKNIFNTFQNFKNFLDPVQEMQSWILKFRSPYSKWSVSLWCQ